MGVANALATEHFFQITTTNTDACSKWEQSLDASVRWTFCPLPSLSAPTHWTNPGASTGARASPCVRLKIGSLECPQSETHEVKSSITTPSEADRQTSKTRLQHFRSLKVHSWSFARWKSRLPDVDPQPIQAELHLSN